MNNENIKQDPNLDLSSSKKPPKLLIAAAVFFLWILGFTGFVVYKNYTLDQAIASKMQAISLKDSAILELKNDPKVQAMDLLTKAKPEIDHEIETSNVAKYLRELEALHSKYSVNFTGFSYTSGKINTSVTAPSGITSDAMTKTINFIHDYRENTASGSFTLLPVVSVSGNQESRNFSVEFKIK